MSWAARTRTSRASPPIPTREVRKSHHFSELVPGDLAAVTRDGDVHRIDVG